MLPSMDMTAYLMLRHRSTSGALEHHTKALHTLLEFVICSTREKKVTLSAIITGASQGGSPETSAAQPKFNILCQLLKLSGAKTFACVCCSMHSGAQI